MTSDAPYYIVTNNFNSHLLLCLFWIISLIQRYMMEQTKGTKYWRRKKKELVLFECGLSLFTQHWKCLNWQIPHTNRSIGLLSNFSPKTHAAIFFPRYYSTNFFRVYWVNDRILLKLAYLRIELLSFLKFKMSLLLWSTNAKSIGC